MAEEGATSFNEAEASLPRNRAHIRQEMPDYSGFNEAEASLPRNRTNGRWHVSPVVGFNEAEASLPRNLCVCVRNAHRPISRFNEAEASLPRNRDVGYLDCSCLPPASMRPRQACLGIHFDVIVSPIQLHALQ